MQVRGVFGGGSGHYDASDLGVHLIRDSSLARGKSIRRCDRRMEIKIAPLMHRDWRSICKQKKNMQMFRSDSFGQQNFQNCRLFPIHSVRLSSIEGGGMSESGTYQQRGGGTKVQVSLPLSPSHKNKWLAFPSSTIVGTWIEIDKPTPSTNINWILCYLIQDNDISWRFYTFVLARTFTS